MKWEYIDKTNKRFKISNLGNVYLCKSKRLSKAGLNSYGYRQVNINRVARLVHRLVAESFIPNPNNYSDVNHKDGNKLNNNFENLEWCSRADNTRHGWRTGLNNLRGEKNPHCKLTANDVKKIRLLYKSGKYSQYDLAKMYSLSQPHIGDIILKQRWAHI